ncbi:hypothetical protein PR048_019188 [Dryococelus australis]|uniref:Uncharacterized protein n=1 Tax=Dryococelus australis TaxID=614101 RepID=A0ABQ9H2X5_9NEOP|nr:hypothetical protein PR048_019188 [Dryococelus australis]
MEQRQIARAMEMGDPEKTRRPAVSSGTIPTCENPRENRTGIEARFTLVGFEPATKVRRETAMEHGRDATAQCCGCAYRSCHVEPGLAPPLRGGVALGPGHPPPLLPTSTIVDLHPRLPSRRTGRDTWT